ncbi:hypothetical protein ACQPTN_21785 [Bradyrhizobium sp. 13971]
MPIIVVATACPFGMSHDERDQCRAGKKDLFDEVARPHQHDIAFERYLAEMRRKQIKVGGRQGRQKAITYARPAFHHGRAPQDGGAARCTNLSWRQAGIRNELTAPGR